MRELLHFLRHAPSTLVLKQRLSQEELYDVVMDRADAAGLGEQRHELVSDLTGEVVEIGCGTGHMFPHYGAGAHVTAVENDHRFAARARERAKNVAAKIDVVLGDAAALPLPDASVDSVVFGLVLCSVADVPKSLDEARRVLKPGGEIRLLEHVRSPRPVTGFFMDVANPIWLALNGQGCRMNRDTEAALREAGLACTDVSAFQVYSAGLPAFPMRRMKARPAGSPP